MNIWADGWDATDDWSGGGAKPKRLVGPGAHGLRNTTDDSCATDRGPALASEVVHFLPEGPWLVADPLGQSRTRQALTASQTGERLWLVHDVEPGENEPVA